jgi:hypothetical protein
MISCGLTLKGRLTRDVVIGPTARLPALTPGSRDSFDVAFRCTAPGLAAPDLSSFSSRLSIRVVLICLIAISI